MYANQLEYMIYEEKDKKMIELPSPSHPFPSLPLAAKLEIVEREGSTSLWL